MATQISQSVALSGAVPKARCKNGVWLTQRQQMALA
jgi:hypothetical protein